MYFQNRQAVGEHLTKELAAYAGQPNAVIALSDGGALVGYPIAKAIGGVLTILLLEPVEIPGENATLLNIREDGKYTYDQMWSTGQLEEFEMEYRTYIEQAKQQNYSELRHALGVSCLASSSLLHDKNIFLVSDGLRNGSSFEAAIDFLKPMPRRKLISITPLAAADVIDRMRQESDEVYCLSTVDGTFETDHYYTDATLPSHSEIVSWIEQGLPKAA